MSNLNLRQPPELRTVGNLILEGLPLTNTSLAAVTSPTRAFTGPTEKIGLAGNQLTAAGLNGVSNGIELGEGDLTDAELRKFTVTIIQMLRFIRTSPYADTKHVGSPSQSNQVFARISSLLEMTIKSKDQTFSPLGL